MSALETFYTVAQRIARIQEACASPLGYAHRGVASWEQDRLMEWRHRKSLKPAQMAELEAIEQQVFGGGL